MDCYDIERGNCNGSCQGASDCPLAQGLNPSKRVMKLYIKKQKEFSDEMEKIIQEVKQDPAYIKAIEEFEKKRCL